jgi:hypothetical protein
VVFQWSEEGEPEPPCPWYEINALLDDMEMDIHQLRWRGAKALQKIEAIRALEG